MTSKRTTQILVGLLLTLVVASLPFPIWDNEFADVAHLCFNELIYWTLVAATIAYVLFVENRPLSTIGFHVPKLSDWLIGVVVAIVTIVGLGVIYFVIFPALDVKEDQQLDKLFSAPGWWLAISVVRAGVSEEILFRGYPIERLQELTGSRAFAATVSVAVFALAHVGPWGWAHFLVAAFGGAMFAWLYLWRRNLWINIFAHCLVDGLAVLS